MWLKMLNGLCFIFLRILDCLLHGKSGITVFSKLYSSSFTSKSFLNAQSLRKLNPFYHFDYNKFLGRDLKVNCIHQWRGNFFYMLGLLMINFVVCKVFFFYISEIPEIEIIWNIYTQRNNSQGSGDFESFQFFFFFYFLPLDAISYIFSLFLKVYLRKPTVFPPTLFFFYNHLIPICFFHHPYSVPSNPQLFHCVLRGEGMPGGTWFTVYAPYLS